MILITLDRSLLVFMYRFARGFHYFRMVEHADRTVRYHSQTKIGCSKVYTISSTLIPQRALEESK